MVGATKNRLILAIDGAQACEAKAVLITDRLNGIHSVPPNIRDAFEIRRANTRQKSLPFHDGSPGSQ
jgi:hypothetical protein